VRAGNAVAEVDRQNPGQLNSVQLNIVTLVDMRKASNTGTLSGALYMMDNSLGRAGRGTAHLQTCCKQGQVLNWIVRPIDMNRRADGTWPPMPRISNIVFLDGERGDEETVAGSKVCTELKIYGMPDRIRSPFTQVYYYWAGTVLSTVPPGVYRYRLVLELAQETGRDRLHLNTVEHPSIRVLPL
jgi:hypothetical protein